MPRKPAKKPPAKARARKDRRGASKGRFGNAAFKPTAEQRIRVEAMVAAGAQQWFIAEDIGISIDTLARHFPSELEHGKHRALSKIGASMVTNALNGDHDAGKFVLARIGGWKQTTAVEQSGPDGGPIVYLNDPPRRDLSHLTEEELIELERLTSKIDRPQADTPNDAAD